MTRVAMITLLLVVCTALIVEAKSIHRRKRNSESLRLKRGMPYGWEKKSNGNGYIYINHVTGETRTSPPTHGSSGSAPAPVQISASERGSCNEGWRHAFGFCYYISAFADIQSHSGAQAACKQQKGELFWPDLPYESFFLKKVLQRVKTSTNFVWTNGEKHNGQWNWGTGHPAFTAPRWSPGQPDGQGECLAVYTHSGFLDDKQCETQYNYICKTKH
ncbi:lithostathine-1-like [Mytilus galloprovincialis]|uniref:lithostathine-1-like n=1 Tax=Mytilus galloprovincialis TaxID=29158 RepID=UPI003F7C12C7